MQGDLVLGIISDTHGLLRPEAVRALQGCGLILHAGDIGASVILKNLQAIAPVHAVRGNIDTQSWARRLPERLTIVAGTYRITIVHQVPVVPPEDSDVVIFGHSHKPGFEERDGVLFFDPGSAGPRRFRLPVTCGRLHIGASGVRPEIIPLLDPDPC